MTCTVCGGKLSSQFRKALYLDHCCLTYIYADDNTLHSNNINLNKSTNINSNKVLHDLEKMSNTLFKWFTDNLLKANPEKSYLLTNVAQEIQINIGGMAISNSKCEVLLGIHIDDKLKKAS